MRQKKNGLENLVLITQLGLNVVTPVLICVLLGSWIDKKDRTSYRSDLPDPGCSLGVA